MSDIDDIERQARAAREFTETIEGATFTLRLPTRLESRVALARVMAANAGETDNDVLAILVERETLRNAVIGWSGVPVSWILDDAADAGEFAYRQAVVPLLLDERPDVADQLAGALFGRLKTYNSRRDTAAKN